MGRVLFEHQSSNDPLMPMRLLTLVADDLSAQNLREAVAKAAPLAEPIIMTIAEQLRAEGRAEGELPTEVQMRLQSASMPEIEHWAERVLLADRLDVVFAD